MDKNGRIRVIEYLEGSLSDGGAETLVKDYALLIDRKRFEPYILVDWIFTDSANYSRLKDTDVKLVSLYPSYSIFWRAVNKFFRNRYIDWKLRRVVRKLKPDVLHIHLAALKHVEKIKEDLEGVKLLYTCHSIPQFYFEEKKGEAEAAEVLIRENGLRLIALHSDMADDLKRRFNTDNVVVVRNGIDMEKFRKPRKTRNEVRNELGIPQSSFVLGHIGRFVKVKNHSFLLSVFERIAEKKPGSRLLLIGDGEDREKVEAEIKSKNLTDRVIILSNRSDIPELLSAMDCFILPSLFEGFPVALLESQASGLRCVVSDRINSEVYLSNLIVPLSLSLSPSVWADTILDENVRGNYENRIDEYDLRKEIRKLERIYAGEE